MTEPATLTINNTEYIRADTIPTPAGPPVAHQIVVADRGWVFVGPTTHNDDGSLTIHPAQNIRRWGTEGKGLGHLAQHGPVESKTVLDAGGTVRIPKHALVFTIDTKADLWA